MRQGQEYITDAIGKYKEAYHWSKKSIIFEGECRFHQEQVDAKKRDDETLMQMDVIELIK